MPLDGSDDGTESTANDHPDPPLEEEDGGGDTGVNAKASGNRETGDSKMQRELSPWTPENSYRHHLINDILNVHENRTDNKVRIFRVFN